MLPTRVPEWARDDHPSALSIDIGPPRGHEYVPTLEDCGTLPALVDDAPGEPRRIRSYWRPSPEELAALNAGESIELVVVALWMVPVSLNVPLPASP